MSPYELGSATRVGSGAAPPLGPPIPPTPVVSRLAGLTVLLGPCGQIFVEPTPPSEHADGAFDRRHGSTLQSKGPATRAEKESLGSSVVAPTTGRRLSSLLGDNEECRPKGLSTAAQAAVVKVGGQPLVCAAWGAPGLCHSSKRAVTPTKVAKSRRLCKVLALLLGQRPSGPPPPPKKTGERLEWVAAQCAVVEPTVFKTPRLSPP